MKDEVRLRFIRGETLKGISAGTGIPLGTLQEWSYKGRWSKGRKAVRAANKERQRLAKEAARAEARERYQRAHDLYHQTDRPVSYIARVTDNRYWTVVDWVRKHGWVRPVKEA